MTGPDVQAALRGLQAAARLERLDGITTEQRHAASRVVDRRMIDASDAGATGAELGDALHCTPAWASSRLARARRSHPDGQPPRDQPPAGLAGDVMPLAVVAARLGVSRSKVGAYRRAGRLPTRRLHGWEVADVADVVALESSLTGRGRTPPQAATPRPDTSNVWLAVPRCARPAPPPWPVNARCRASAGHRGDHDYRRTTANPTS